MRETYRKFKTFNVIFEAFDVIFGISKTVFEVFETIFEAFDATFEIYVLTFKIEFEKFAIFIINNVEIVIIIYFIIKLRNIIIKSNYNFRN